MYEFAKETVRDLTPGSKLKATFLGMLHLGDAGALLPVARQEHAAAAPLQERARQLAVEVVIVHQGKSFDPQAVKSPDMRDYLTHYRRGGLGMHLMRSLMDTVEYRTFPDKRSEVHLVKRFPAKIGR